MIATLDEAVDALLAFPGPRPRGHCALTDMAALMEVLGHPEVGLPVIHVTGTSGKTSTSYLIRAALEAAGRHTGLTVSPHIMGINERVQLGGAPLDADRFCTAVEALLSRVAGLRAQVTYFELVTALALTEFAAAHVDEAVIEVGIGGRRDATNICFSPDKVAVIGPIGLDHTEKLGGTLAEIAAHKAGIIVPGGVAFVADQAPEARDVVLDHARSVGAVCTVVEAPHVPDDSAVPAFQWRNWALAEAAVRFVAERDGFAPPSLDLEEFLRTAVPPARYEWLRVGDHEVLLDGAHNPQKMAGLVETMRQHRVGPLPVLATLSAAPPDKVMATVAALAPVATSVIVPEFALGHDGRVKESVPAEEVAQAAARVGLAARVVPDVAAAVESLLALPDRRLLVTGSLYLAALVRPLLVGARR